MPFSQWWAKWRLSTFDLYPWGKGNGMQGQICDILRPQLAINGFLPLWPHRFPHFEYIHLGGGGVGGGSDIRSMSSIRPICKCQCPPLLSPHFATSPRVTPHPQPPPLFPHFRPFNPHIRCDRPLIQNCNIQFRRIMHKWRNVHIHIIYVFIFIWKISAL